MTKSSMKKFDSSPQLKAWLNLTFFVDWILLFALEQKIQYPPNFLSSLISAFLSWKFDIVDCRFATRKII